MDMTRRKHTNLWRAIALAAAVLAAGWAQAEEGGGYRLRVGDTVRVVTEGEADYTGLFTIGPEGTIALRDQMVGSVEVAGLTAEEAARRLADQVGRYVRSPVVSVEVARFKVLVTGAARAPGQYEVQAGGLLMEAITLAAGSRRIEDLERVYVKRAGGEVREVNLRSFIEGGDATQNLPLRPGDTVAVGYLDPASAEAEYRVSGAVEKAGRFRLEGRREVDLRDALATAGGLLADADMGQARIVRSDGTTESVDLRGLSEQPRSAGGPVLRAGDELFVPRYPLEVEVLGAVAKPGRYRLAEGTTYLDAVAMAGGFTNDARLGDACVVRRGPPAVRVAANLKRTLSEGDMSQNPVLQDGDVLFVPPADPRSGSRNPLNVLGISLYSLLYLLR